jgi:hypothetical protein
MDLGGAAVMLPYTADLLSHRSDMGQEIKVATLPSCLSLIISQRRPFVHFHGELSPAAGQHRKDGRLYVAVALFIILMIVLKIKMYDEPTVAEGLIPDQGKIHPN